MDLPSTLNAPRRCRLSGKTFFVRALSIEAMAIILAWLDDVIPGRAERIMPPSLSSPEAQEALKSWPGRFLLTWLAVRDAGMSYDDAALLAFPDQSDPDDVHSKELEHLRIIDILFTKRRTVLADPSGPKRDIAESWCSDGMAQLAKEIGLEAVGRLSLDQYEWLMAGGEIDPQHAPSSAEASQEEVAGILDQAKQIEGVDPAILAAYERALAAFKAADEIVTDEEGPK